MNLKNSFMLILATYMASCSPKMISYNPNIPNKNLTEQQMVLEEIVEGTNLPKVSFAVANKKDRGIYLYDPKTTKLIYVPANFDKSQLGELMIVYISKGMYKKIKLGNLNNEDKKELFNSYLKGQAKLSWGQMNIEKRNKFILLVGEVNPVEEYIKLHNEIYNNKDSFNIPDSIKPNYNKLLKQIKQ
jgi:hypothetical protein